MSQFIRRLLGGGEPSHDASTPSQDAGAPTEATDPADATPPSVRTSLTCSARSRHALELAQRQLKYARYSW